MKKIIDQNNPSNLNLNIFLFYILMLILIIKLYYLNDLNSIVSLESQVEWRYIGNSDLSKITQSVLAEGWKDYVVDSNHWKIFNLYSHPLWSDDYTPLNKFYIENITTGVVEPLWRVWPVADSRLEGLVLPSLPIRGEYLNKLDIWHERILAEMNTRERILEWLQNQKKIFNK